MASFFRYRVDLNNFGDGSPGVVILHSTAGLEDSTTDIGNFMSQIRNGFDSVKQYLVSGMTVNVNQEVTKHDVATGRLSAVHVITSPGTVTGSGSAAGSRATQAVCRHNTDSITDLGKRLVGRSYVGPISTGAAIDSGGHISPAAQTAFTSMWNGMQDVAGTLRLIVWHRPKLDHTNGEVISPGSFGHVQNSVCLVAPGVMRSRRD